MKIWRIETLDGVGPYQADLESVARDGNIAWPTFMYEEPDLHPHPYHDGFPYTWPDMLPRDVHYGFDTEEKLASWFFPDPWDDRLMEDLGLCVRVFEVGAEHVEIGNSQAMFRKDHAKLVAEYFPTEYTQMKLREQEESCTI